MLKKMLGAPESCGNFAVKQKFFVEVIIKL